MSFKMTDQERELATAVQSDIARAKKRLKKILAIQEFAGRAQAAHAAHIALNAVNVAHAEITEQSFKCFPEDTAELVLLGGGGRG